MSCLVNKGLYKSACQYILGGLNETAYLANLDEIGTYTDSTSGIVTAVNMATSGLGFYEFQLAKDTSSFLNELQISGENKWINQTVVLSIPRDDFEAIAVANKLGLAKVVVILKKRNGKMYIIGRYNGLEATVGTFGSGTASGDPSGLNFTFVASEIEYTPQFMGTIPMAS